MKFALGIGGSYGRGVVTCRIGKDFKGKWGAPTLMALEGGSVGLQLGGEATDFVLLLMNSRSASSILSSKVKLGGDTSAAAGPVGRTASAETDVAMQAEILTYSRARGLFGGVSASRLYTSARHRCKQTSLGKGNAGEGHRDGGRDPCAAERKNTHRDAR